MSHLDELSAALVDDELTHDQRDRALVHLTGCDTCRDEVDAQRRAKAALRALPSPTPSPEFFARLVALPTTASARPATAPHVVRRAPAASVRPAAGRPANGPLSPRVVSRPGSRRLGRGRVAVGSVSAVALACGVAVLLGGNEQAPAVRPPVANFVREHNATTGNLPLTDPASVVLTSFGR